MVYILKVISVRLCATQPARVETFSLSEQNLVELPHCQLGGNLNDYGMGCQLVQPKYSKRAPGESSRYVMPSEQFAYSEEIGVVWDAEE